MADFILKFPDEPKSNIVFNEHQWAPAVHSHDASLISYRFDGSEQLIGGSNVEEVLTKVDKEICYLVHRTFKASEVECHHYHDDIYVVEHALKYLFNEVDGASSVVTKIKGILGVG